MRHIERVRHRETNRERERERERERVREIRREREREIERERDRERGSEFKKRNKEYRNDPPIYYPDSGHPQGISHSAHGA